jgi:CRISPR type IV-associated protein Csf3
VQPLKITFHLVSDMVYPSMPLHLDALIAYAKTQDNLVLLEDEPTQEALLALADNLPFVRHTQDGDWVYKASALMPLGDMTHSRLFYTQRNNLAALAELMVNKKVKSSIKTLVPMSHSNKLDTTRGAQRNLLGYFNTTNVKALVAYCVGDKDELQEYLVDSGWITHIGARRRQGLGMLSHIEIEEDVLANEMWQWRVKPFKTLDNDTQVIATCKPPYWMKVNSQLAFMPSELI